MPTTAPVECHNGTVSWLVFSPDGSRLVSAALDFTIKIWDAKTGLCIATVETRSEPYEIVFSPDGGHLVVGVDKNVNVWNVAESFRCRASFECVGDETSCIVFSPRGSRLVVGIGDAAKLWDVGTRTCIATYQGSDCNSFSAVFSHDGNHLALGAGDTIEVWDIATGVCIRTFTGHGRFDSATFSPDGKWLISNQEYQAAIWNIITGERQASFEDVDDSSLGFSTDNSRAIFVDRDYLQVVDLKKNSLIRYTINHPGRLSSLAFLPDEYQLETDTGVKSLLELLDIDPSSAAFRRLHDHYDLSVSGWGRVFCNNERVLQLPDDYEATESESSGQTLAIGFNDGRVCILSLEIENLPVHYLPKWGELEVIDESCRLK